MRNAHVRLLVKHEESFVNLAVTTWRRSQIFGTESRPFLRRPPVPAQHPGQRVHNPSQSTGQDPRPLRRVLRQFRRDGDPSPPRRPRPAAAARTHVDCFAAQDVDGADVDRRQPGCSLPLGGLPDRQPPPVLPTASGSTCTPVERRAEFRVCLTSDSASLAAPRVQVATERRFRTR